MIKSFKGVLILIEHKPVFINLIKVKWRFQCDEIYQTRVTVFHQDIQTLRREFNMTRSGVFLTTFEVFG